MFKSAPIRVLAALALAALFAGASATVRQEIDFSQNQEALIDQEPISGVDLTKVAKCQASFSEGPIAVASKRSDCLIGKSSLNCPVVISKGTGLEAGALTDQAVKSKRNNELVKGTVNVCCNGMQYTVSSSCCHECSGGCLRQTACPVSTQPPSAMPSATPTQSPTQQPSPDTSSTANDDNESTNGNDNTNTGSTNSFDPYSVKNDQEGSVDDEESKGFAIDTMFFVYIAAGVTALSLCAGLCLFCAGKRKAKAKEASGRRSRSRSNPQPRNSASRNGSRRQSRRLAPGEVNSFGMASSPFQGGYNTAAAMHHTAASFGAPPPPLAQHTPYGTNETYGTLSVAMSAGGGAEHYSPAMASATSSSYDPQYANASYV